MNTTQIESEIKKCESNYWNALGSKDVDTALSLTHFPCTVAGPQGSKHVTENELRQMFNSFNPEEFKNIQLQNQQVEVVNETTAIFTYSYQAKEGEMSVVSTWTKENGKWVCAFHSENPLKIQ